jgi:hypothetical protein
MVFPDKSITATPVDDMTLIVPEKLGFLLRRPLACQDSTGPTPQNHALKGTSPLQNRGNQGFFVRICKKSHQREVEGLASINGRAILLTTVSNKHRSQKTSFFPPHSQPKNWIDLNQIEVFFLPISSDPLIL